MSLDLYLACPTCEHADHERLNITHNVRRICVEAGCDPWEWEGRTARDTLPDLSAAIASLAAGDKDFSRWVPENGWGSVGGTFRFLERVRMVAEQYPDRTWRVSD